LISSALFQKGKTSNKNLLKFKKYIIAVAKRRFIGITATNEGNDNSVFATVLANACFPYFSLFVSSAWHLSGKPCCH